MYQQNPVVLIADPIVLENEGYKSQRTPREIVESMGGVFVEGPVPEGFSCSPGKTIYSYQPNLKPAEIDAELSRAQYEGVIVAAKKVTNTNVKFAVRIGAGTNNLDDLKAAGVIVMNTPGFNSKPTAEAIVYNVNHARGKTSVTNHFAGQHTDVMANSPRADANNLSAYNHGESLQFAGAKPEKMKVSIIGAGHIGGLAAQAFMADGHDVIQYSRSNKNQASNKVEAATDAEVLIVQTPLNAETKGIIDRSVFEKLKPGATIVNAGRAELIDIPALQEAIEKGIVKHLIVDVDHFPDREDSPMKPYIELAKLLESKGGTAILTPHTYADTHNPSRNAGALQAVLQAQREVVRLTQPGFAEPVINGVSTKGLKVTAEDGCKPLTQHPLIYEYTLERARADSRSSVKAV